MITSGINAQYSKSVSFVSLPHTHCATHLSCMSPRRAAEKSSMSKSSATPGTGCRILRQPDNTLLRRPMGHTIPADKHSTRWTLRLGCNCLQPWEGVKGEASTKKIRMKLAALKIQRPRLPIYPFTHSRPTCRDTTAPIACEVLPTGTATTS